MEQGIRQLTATDLNTLTTTQQDSLGAMGATGDGRLFRYVKFGGTSTIAPGQLMCAAAVTSAYQGLAITAVNTGGQTAANLLANSTTLVVTNGATSITQDQFGFVQVNQTSGTNEGPIVYKLRGNTAAGNAATLTLSLQVSEPLRNAETLVAGTDTVNLVLNPYSAVVATATAATPLGATVIQVPNSSSVTNYGWIQTYGMSFLTNDAGGNLTVGEGVSQSTTTAGNIVATGATTVDIGNTLKAFNASTAGPVFLRML